MSRELRHDVSRELRHEVSRELRHDMSRELRHDPLTGAPAVIVRSRQDRPNLPAGACPFCPGGVEAPGMYRTRWFPNRWPPLPDGRAEILLFAPEHDLDLGSLGAERTTAVLELWADRSQAQGERSDVEYVLLFENRGRAVGATIAHPHGQLYAFESVPPAARAELEHQGACPLCAVPPAALTVAEAGGWRVWVPWAAAWPYEVRLAPVEHVGRVADARATFAGAAAALSGTVRALDALWGEQVPYMLWTHQRPFDGAEWPAAHLHIHLVPLWRAAGTPRFVAAGELGSGVFFNPVAPEDAAGDLRRAWR